MDTPSILHFSIDLLGQKILRGIMSVSSTRAICGDEACQDFKVTLLTEATHTHAHAQFLIIQFDVWYKDSVKKVRRIREGGFNV